MSQGIIAINYRQYPGPERDLVQLQAGRVTAAIVSFMMMLDYRYNFVRKVHVAQDIGADYRMHHNLGEFG